MKVFPLQNFICPVDGLPLLKDKTTLHCKNGHGFDVAREGYCNLLLVQQKASLDPGDNKTMVASRQRFLESGHFLPIADHLFNIINDMAINAGEDASLRIVDAGCGEGYYLHQLSDQTARSSHPATLHLAGFDISKWAIKAAAKRSTRIAWAVAGNKHLPFASKSVDIILSMFGFPMWESFKTAQPVGGRVILVDPVKDHLIQLRKIIYPTVKPSRPASLQAAFNCGYTLEKEECLKFSIDLKNASEIQDLLAMTPHGFRITEKARGDIQELKRLTVSVDLMLRILQAGN